jgi:hypothetical protein
MDCNNLMNDDNLNSEINRLRNKIGTLKNTPYCTEYQREKILCEKSVLESTLNSYENLAWVRENGF